MKGEITYNGHRLEEFVPRKTSAYINQRDLHVAEMTVRETLDFSARCQGVGNRFDRQSNQISIHQTYISLGLLVFCIQTYISLS